MPRTAQRNAAVPPAAVRRPGQKLTFLGYGLEVTRNAGLDVVTIFPAAQAITIHPTTYAWLKNDNAAMTSLVHEKAEAVRTMQTRMIDVSGYSSMPTVPTARPKPVVTPTGIKALCADIQALVGDMAANTSPTMEQQAIFATRYGKYRDTMASLRTAFMEAEGEFETAQMLLIQMMGADE